MTYALTFAVKLLPADTGLAATLLAKIYNSARVLQTTTVAGVGWTETGGGEYVFVYSSFADNLSGSIDFYNGAVFETCTAFSPPDTNIISVNEVSTAADNIQAIYDGVSAGAPAKFTTLITTGTTTLNALTVSNATTLSGQVSISGAFGANGALYLNNTTGPGLKSVGSTYGINAIGTTKDFWFGTAALSLQDVVADSVWDEAIADHLGLGSTGEKLNSAGGSGDVTSIDGSAPAAVNLKNALLNSGTGNIYVNLVPDSISDISDEVWNELVADHLAPGSTGAQLNSSGSGDIVSIVGDATAAVNLKSSLQGDANNVATKGSDLDNLKTVKDSINTKIDSQMIMSVDQLKSVLQ